MWSVTAHVLVRRILVSAMEGLIGSNPRSHRIPFGPNRRRNIYLAFHVSPRMWFGLDEQCLAKWAHHYLHQGVTAYDVGAHVGYTSLLFSDLVGTTGSVHAFEILGSTAEHCRETMRLNSVKNVQVHTVGLGSEPSRCVVAVPPNLCGNVRADRQGCARTEPGIIEVLDQYVTEHRLPLPAFIKVDIEGMEVDFLAGAEKTILESNPVLIIEFHSADLLRNGFDLLIKWHYQLYERGGKTLCARRLANLTKFHDSVLCIPQKCA